MEAPADWTAAGVHEVVDGVYRIPLPLPMDGLRAVNVYAIRDGDGLVLIDGGWAVSDAREQLLKSLDGIGYQLSDIRRFLVTHMHRDHYTLAVQLRQEFGSRIALGIGEQPSMEFVADATLHPLTPQYRIMERAGGNPLAEVYPLEKLPPERVTWWEMPDEWLAAPRTTVALDSGPLEAVATPGHTQGHVVFDDAARGLLFAGDHVLPRITPSIGFQTVPSESPLRDFLGSLRLVRSMPDRMLLPAHGPVAPSVHARVDELIEHHDVRLRQTAEAVEAGAVTGLEVAQRLRWTRRERRLDELDRFNQMLAVCETVAHLDLLAEQGRLRRTDQDGVSHYVVA